MMKPMENLPVIKQKKLLEKSNDKKQNNMEKIKVIVGLGSCGIAAGAKKVFDKLKIFRKLKT